MSLAFGRRTACLPCHKSCSSNSLQPRKREIHSWKWARPWRKVYTFIKTVIILRILDRITFADIQFISKSDHSTQDVFWPRVWLEYCCESPYGWRIEDPMDNFSRANHSRPLDLSLPWASHWYASTPFEHHFEGITSIDMKKKIKIKNKGGTQEAHYGFTRDGSLGSASFAVGDLWQEEKGFSSYVTPGRGLGTAHLCMIIFSLNIITQINPYH